MTTLPQRSPQMSNEVFDALVGVLSVAPEDVTSGDVLTSLHALHVARPHLPELSIALAQRHLLAGDFQPARDVLESMDSLVPRQPLVSALLAFTLHKLEDPAWRLRAFEVENVPHDEVSAWVLATMREQATA